VVTDSKGANARRCAREDRCRTEDEEKDMGAG
jgi:hypothetical protein